MALLDINGLTDTKGKKNADWVIYSCQLHGIVIRPNGYPCCEKYAIQRPDLLENVK